MSKLALSTFIFIITFSVKFAETGLARTEVFDPLLKIRGAAKHSIPVHDAPRTSPTSRDRARESSRHTQMRKQHKHAGYEMKKLINIPCSDLPSADPKIFIVISVWRTAQRVVFVCRQIFTFI